MITAVAIMATISVILIIENQNSASPNALTAMRLIMTSSSRNPSSMSPFHAETSYPSVRKNVTQYCPTAVISVMPMRMSTIQYDHSANLPHPSPR